MSWARDAVGPEHAAASRRDRSSGAARRVVRIPILVGVIVLSFGAGLGAGALTHQEQVVTTAADGLSADHLKLMAVSPTPTSDDASAAELLEDGADEGGSDGAPDVGSTPDDTQTDGDGNPDNGNSNDGDADDGDANDGDANDGDADDGDAGDAKPAKPKKKADPDKRDDTGLSLSDREAGILEAGTPQSASGELLRVPGDSEAPGAGELVRVRVEVEDGLPVDGLKFAEMVMAILNDSRGWGAEGKVTFARVEGDADMRVVLASPDKVDEMCAPLRTKGEYSCGRNGHAAINYTRWFDATEEFASRTQYRTYVINHEVGHLLGKQHVSCPGPGEIAPIMQQQSVKVAPCEPNGWPFPDND